MEVKDELENSESDLKHTVENKSTIRRKGESLKDDTSNFCLSEHLCDVWFAFKETSAKLPAHRLILSMRSEVFEAMFYGPMAESDQTVVIEDIETTTMKMLLRYVYTDTVDLDGMNVMSCLYAAKKYALHGMVTKCVTYLEGAVTVATSCNIYEQAKFYGESPLEEKCFNFIVENANAVFKSNCPRNLTYESLLKILECDHLASGELENFSVAIAWGEYQCKKKNLEKSAENLRACLGEIIYQIRFPLMSPQTFATQVVHTGILTNEEMLDIYYYLATKSSSREMVRKFPCKKRTLVISVDSSSLSQAYEGYILLINTSAPVKLKSIKGDFVSDVCRVNASNIGRQDIVYEILNGQLNLTDPLLLRPHSGNIQIVFAVNNKHRIEDAWSSNANISRTVKDTTINVRRVPHGLKSLFFEEV